MRLPYLEFVLTNIICIENALKGTEIVFVSTVFVQLSFTVAKIANAFSSYFLTIEFYSIFVIRVRNTHILLMHYCVISSRITVKISSQIIILLT